VTAPSTGAEWAAAVTALYARRAEAFVSGSAEPLAGVWAEGAPQRQADEAHVAALAGAGERLRSFAPTVADVTVVRSDGDRTELRLTDGWGTYEVVRADDPAGPALRTGPARPMTPVRVVLTRTPGGWRMLSAERLVP
jgi:hypothetical protein